MKETSPPPFWVREIHTWARVLFREESNELLVVFWRFLKPPAPMYDVGETRIPEIDPSPLRPWTVGRTAVEKGGNVSPRSFPPASAAEHTTDRL